MFDIIKGIRCPLLFCEVNAISISSVLVRGMARTMLGLSRFGVGQWPCALDGYVSRIHNANSSLIGHRHDPRPSCAHARSTVRAVDFSNPYACTPMLCAFTSQYASRGSYHISPIQFLKRKFYHNEMATFYLRL